MEGFFQRYLALYRPITNALNQLLSEYKLSYALWQVIFYINKNGMSTLVDIAHHYKVEKPTITRRVQRLEEMQIVQPIPSEDRREKMIVLTDDGVKLYQTCRVKITDLENTIIQGISTEEQQIMDSVLMKTKDNLLHRKDSQIE